ncbi:MAG TPA: AarF/ABC1/UbiB kinase family protein [archaeon]|nr:AarF/ABC1/UbiB kinase family protein [archaeon]
MSLFKKKKLSSKRAREIVRILAKYGFEFVSEKTKLGRSIPFINKKSELVLVYNSFERARMVLEELGPTFVKMGQILSTRPDLIGQPFSIELSKLQDAVTPFSYKEVEHEMKCELGGSVEELFKSFDKKPIASASIAQVHLAVTKNGEKVAVKIQRPGIEEKISQDVQIMHYIAELAQKYNNAWEEFRLTEIVEEFERSIVKELNFELEGKNIMRFNEMYLNDKNIIIPKYFPSLSSKRIITMSYIKGVSFSQLISSGKDYGFDKKELARIGAEAYFKQVLVFGLFHADLHPGNLIAIKGNKIGIVDFGMVGWIDEESISDLSKLFIYLIDCDAKNIINQLVIMNLIEESVDVSNMKIEINDLMQSYYGLDLKELNLGDVATQLMLLLTKYKIRIPKEYTMLSRSLLLVEGSAQKLDPSFNAVETFKPFAQKLAVQKLSPVKLFEKFKTEFLEVEGLTRVIPRTIKNILAKLESGKIKLEFEHKNLDVFATSLDHITNKLVLAIILGSLIIGSSLAMLATDSMHINGLPLITLIGFGFCAILGVLLVFSSMQRIEVI